jgi:D-alanyl-lipoteichoic acid acyltransferase DltB (MBOAT superfamily)
MLFTSFNFLVFFTIVFLGYWLLSRPLQNRLLLLASYFFYGLIDWRFLFLIAISTTVDFFIARAIHAVPRDSERRNLTKRKLLLIASLAAQLGTLGFFKYFNFFLSSIEGLFSVIGLHAVNYGLEIVLPVGISFYTFKTITYTIDIYRGELAPASSFLDYALFVSFFPTLLAGPIIRARDFLPQLVKVRTLSRADFVEGIHLIFWGLVKKVYMADNLASIANKMFANPEPTGMHTLVASYCYAFQIYGDFSGYSDIAQGCSKLLGLNIVSNFRYPYAATNPSDFWTRWHISFSTWIRDYIFTPLGGAWHGMAKAYRNLAITMLLAGLWHGAAWTFVFWGAYQGLLLISHRVTQPLLKRWGKGWRKVTSLGVRRLVRMAVTFHLVCVGWIIFRAESVSSAGSMLLSLTKWETFDTQGAFLALLQFAGPVVIVEIAMARMSVNHLYQIKQMPALAKTVVYALILYLLAFHASTTQGFIYSQF